MISRATFLASSSRVRPGLPLRAPMLALTSTMSTASCECRAASCHCGCASAKLSSAARASNTIKFKSRNRRCRLLLLLSRIFIAACQNIRLDTVASSRFGRRRYRYTSKGSDSSDSKAHGCANAITLVALRNDRIAGHEVSHLPVQPMCCCAHS